MAELKTKLTKNSVQAFLMKIPDSGRRKDAQSLLELMREVTGAKPALWGSSIIGFGSYHYKYASGQQGDWPIISFSPRKQNLTLYVMMPLERHADLLAKLGKHKARGSCLYINHMADVDLPTLRELIKRSLKQKRTGGV